VTLLAGEGIKIARRTVAKYREALKIAPSNERKQRPTH
jgi:RNA polymerase sigma-54 factor